jgi:type IV pilus assembly protein PilM
MVAGLLLATPREPILDAVAAVERAGLQVARVDLSSFGSLRAIAAETPSVEAIIDIGAQLTTVVIHEHGVPRLVRTLARGGQQLTEQLADRMSINEQEAETVKCEVGLQGERPELTRMLTEALRPLVAEIRTSVQYFRSSNPGEQIARMSITGGGSWLRGMSGHLEEHIGLTTSLVDPGQHLGDRRSSDPLGALGPGHASAVSIGLAMGAAA